MFASVDPNAKDADEEVAPRNAYGTKKTADDHLLDRMAAVMVKRLIEKSVEKEDCAICLDV